MPIYIDNEQCNLLSLQSYTGTEIVRLKFQKAYKHLKENFWDQNLPVRFRHSKMRYGDKRGRIGESYEFSTIEETEQGTKVIRYADNAVPKQGGGFTYRPPNLDWETRDMTFAPGSNIEKCLFIYLYVCREGKSEDIKLLDEENEAMIERVSYEKASGMFYFLFNSDSPLLKDEAKLSKICYAWGIHGAGFLGMNKKIIALKTAIEVAEKNKDKSRGYAAFDEAVRGFSRTMECRALVQRAHDFHKIKYNDKGYFAYMQGKEEVATLCKVPPVQNMRKIEFLADYLEKNPEKFDELSDSIGEEGMARTNERKPLNLPEEITREYLENLSNGPNGFNELKKMLTDIKSSWKGKKKEEVLSELITYYILEKKHLKPQV